MAQSWLKSAAPNWAAGLAVGFSGVLISGFFAFSQYQAMQQLEQERLRQAVKAFSEVLTHRIDAYTETAYGLRSLFVVNPATSRKAFEEAVVRLDVLTRYPGIKNIAFTRYVTAEQKSAFERSVRADTSLEPAGYPNFSIRPAGERSEYFVADYLWPQAGSKGVHGLDISAQPTNLASMRYAMGTGNPTASGPFDLIQEQTHKVGFVVRVPVFSNDPARTFLGSVAVTLRVFDLFTALQKEGALRGLHIALTDLGSNIPDSPVTVPFSMFTFDEDASNSLQPVIQSLDVYGRRWELKAHAATSYLSDSERSFPIWVGLSGLLISALLGMLTGLLGKGRRHALDNLAETNALLQSVLDHVPIRVFWKDRESRYLGCNQLFAQDAGRSSANDIAGHLDQELGWANQSAVWRQDDLQVMESGSARLRYIEQQSSIGGQTVWLQTSKVPLRNALGDIVGVLGIYDDITERRITEDELAQYRASLEKKVAQRTAELEAANRHLRDTQFAMDSVGIGIYWVDIASSTLLDINRYAAELLGYPMEQMRGMSLNTLMPQANVEVLTAMARQTRLESRVHREMTVVRKDGSLVPVDVIAYYQPGTTATPERITAFVTDITARKEAENEILRATNAATAANQAKSAFLANMSHEIRTPLNAITGMAHLIRKSGLTEEQSSRLTKLEIASEHLLHIIDAILEIAKIEAGKITLSQHPLLVEQIVDNVTGMLQDRAAARGLRLDMHIEPMPANLEGDETRLQQCLLNYVGNAIKFSENGAVTLRARMQQETTDHVEVLFEVEDNGVGIAEAAVERLFNVFEQADNSITRKFGGTGLGLAITRKLVELMDGQVGVRSTPGVGSVFWFTCKLHKGVPQVQQESPALPEDAEESLRQQFQERYILLAEDDEFNQEVGKLLLEQVGLKVDIAGDGAQALARCAERAYDLVLMDLHMPVMDGLEATQRIRQLPDYSQTPIIALTANTLSEDRDRCMQSGMNDFITKPVIPKSLYKLLLHWLRQS